MRSRPASAGSRRSPMPYGSSTPVAPSLPACVEGGAQRAEWGQRANPTRLARKRGLGTQGGMEQVAPPSPNQHADCALRNSACAANSFLPLLQGEELGRGRTNRRASAPNAEVTLAAQHCRLNQGCDLAFCINHATSFHRASSALSLHRPSNNGARTYP